MRIGLVTDFYYPWIGGPSIFIRNLGYGLSDRGHSVSLLCPSTTAHSDREQDGSIDVTRVRTVPSPVGFDLRLAPWPRSEIHQWLQVTAPDVVHVHHPFPISATAIFEARRSSIPVAATNHTIPECSLWGMRGTGALYNALSASFGRWITFLLNRCDSVTTPTATAARALRALGYRHAVEPISNGVDTTRFRPGNRDATLRRRLGLDDRPIVLYTGRLDAEKQMDVWLRAASQSLRAGAVQFAVGGRGSDRSRLEQLAHDLGMDDAVRFIDYVEEDELPALYRLADLYFITSPVELQSISTLEAIATGLPVVAVDAGALPELVVQGRNGYLVGVGDWAAASEALNSLLWDGMLRSKMSTRSREAALTHDLQKSIEAYERFLQKTAHSVRGETRGRAPAPGG